MNNFRLDPKKIKKRYSDDEMTVIRDLVGQASIESIAEKLGRSVSGIYQKIEYMKARGQLNSKNNHSNRHKPYSIDEIHYLCRFAGILSTDEIAKKLNRNKKSIITKAAKLKISLRLYGEKHHSAKLTAKDIELIRELKNEGISHAEIARKFDVSDGHISRIVYYHTRLADNPTMMLKD